ncbi:MAG TPA: zinc ribbon domain-containing protein [Nitrososphaera sp.]
MAPIKSRSHVDVWKWVQKYADCADRFLTDRRLVSTIFVDETLLQKDDVKGWQRLKLPARRKRKKGKRKMKKKSRRWSGGMKVLETAIGGITGALLKKTRTPVVIPPDFKSTEICSGCGRLNAVAIGERTYRCEYCQLVIDRDINAAVNIEREGIEKYLLHLPAERRKVTPVDIRTSTSSSVMECLSSIPYVYEEASHGGGNRKPLSCFSRR